MRIFARRFAAAVRPPLAAARLALAPEIAELRAHAALLNQTTPRALCELADVRPMMRLFARVAAHGAGDAVAADVVRALGMSARDASFALRKLPFARRAPERRALFADLREHADAVRAALNDGHVEPQQAVVNGLYAAYELVHPQSGIDMYEELHAQQATAPDARRVLLEHLTHELVVPCIVKARASLALLESVAAEASTDRGRAYLAWGFLKHGEVPRAQALFDELVARQDALPPKTLAFLLDAFVGDAPAHLAASVFATFQSHVPHAMSAARLLQAVAADGKAEPLLAARQARVMALYSDYVRRLAAPSELDAKSATLSLVAALSADGRAAPLVQSLPALLELHTAKFGTAQTLLNIVLAEAAKLPPAADVGALATAVLDYLAAQPCVTLAPVSFRVQLNALPLVPDADRRLPEVWARRQALPEPISRLDLVALAKAGAPAEFYEQQLQSAGLASDAGLRRLRRR